MGGEVAGLGRARPHVEGGLPAVGGVLEHVVEHEQAAGHHEARPSLVVAERDVERVAAVDEHEPERRRPVRGDRRRAPDHRDDDVLETGALDRAPEPRQRVHAAGARIDEPVVVMLPARLVLLRPAVVVDGVQHRPAGARRRAQVDRRLPAVRADLEQRPERGGLETGRVQRETFVVGHEADRVLRRCEQYIVHCFPFSALRAGPLGPRLTAAQDTCAAVARLWNESLARPVASAVMETQPQAPDRNLAMELVRGTEAAALAAGRWMGRGDKNAADGAAVDAMRLVLNTVSMDGVVVIGEGEKDEAPMLYNGEEVGNGTPPQVDIAVDPLEGTTLTAHGPSQRDLGDRDRRTRHDVRPRARASTWTRSRWARKRSTSIDINAPVKAQPRSGRQGARRGRRRHHRGDPRPSPSRGHHP